MANIERYKIEDAEGWREWGDKIPALQFDPEWMVKIIPPFTGAMVRFMVRSGDKTASVYLDCHDSLGCMGEPYWEVYPIDGDTGRCLMAETDELMALIRQSIEA